MFKSVAIALFLVACSSSSNPVVDAQEAGALVPAPAPTLDASVIADAGSDASIAETLPAAPAKPHRPWHPWHPWHPHHDAGAPTGNDGGCQRDE